MVKNHPTPMTETSPQAFVVMPFDEEFDPIYERLIRTALERAGFEVTRADTRLDQQAVMRSVIEGLAKADLVVADVTGRNPNVMYELGIAHGLRRPTVTLTQDISDLPFDLKIYRAFEYSTHFEAAERLSSDLIETGIALLNGQASWGSPVTDFSPAELSAPRLGGEVAQRPTDSVSSDASQGFLDYLQAADEAGHVILNAFSVIAAATVEVGAKLETQSQRIAALQVGEPGPGAVRQYQRLALAAAKSIDDYAAQMEEVLPEIEGAAHRVVEGGLGYAEWLRAVSHDDESTAGVEGYTQSLRELHEGATETRDQVLDLREAVQGLRGVSQPLTKASHRASRGLDQIVAVQETLIAFATKTLGLLGEDDLGQ